MNIATTARVASIYSVLAAFRSCATISPMIWTANDINSGAASSRRTEMVSSVVLEIRDLLPFRVPKDPPITCKLSSVRDAPAFSKQAMMAFTTVVVIVVALPVRQASLISFVTRAMIVPVEEELGVAIEY